MNAHRQTDLYHHGELPHSQRHRDVAVLCTGGQRQPDQIKAQPAEQGHHEWSTYAQLDTGNGQTLKGNTDDPHPDADPSNNVVGTVKLMWALTRIAKP